MGSSATMSFRMDALPAVTTDIPARLDGLRWSRFHLLLIVALGISWMLDGLEVTIVGAMGGVLENAHTLHLTAGEVGAVASFYITGAVCGALGFGWLTDRYGRRKIFFATLACYLTGVALSAFSWNFLSFAAFRMLTGFGIGGEYAAVNTAIDELMPARLRGDNRPDKRMAQRDCNLYPPSARLWRGALGSWGWSGNVLRI